MNSGLLETARQCGGVDCGYCNHHIFPSGTGGHFYGVPFFYKLEAQDRSCRESAEAVKVRNNGSMKRMMRCLLNGGKSGPLFLMTSGVMCATLKLSRREE